MDSALRRPPSNVPVHRGPVPGWVRWWGSLTPEERRAHASKAGRAHRLTGFNRLKAIANLVRNSREEALRRLAKAQAKQLALKSIPRLR